MSKNLSIKLLWLLEPLYIYLILLFFATKNAHFWLSCLNEKTFAVFAFRLEKIREIQWCTPKCAPMAPTTLSSETVHNFFYAKSHSFKTIKARIATRAERSETVWGAEGAEKPLYFSNQVKALVIKFVHQKWKVLFCQYLFCLRIFQQ